MNSTRLSSGGLIDRTQPINFTFDGKAYRGLEGDTLASALIANGVKLVGRSFKYHRPRGIMSAGSEEPNALVEIHKGESCEPNTRATMIKLFEGLDARSQNSWPNLKFDIMAPLDRMAPFLTAGFYYKTFMWPAAFWEKLYEPFIRRSAGLGSLAKTPDPDQYDNGFLHCDVLVIGAGAAGLMAAVTAGRSGAQVIIADEDFKMGGRLLNETHTIDNDHGIYWVSKSVAELGTMPNVRMMPRTTVFGALDHGTYGAVQTHSDAIAVSGPRQTNWRIFAKRTILAAGAVERPIAFANNDRPGIMLAGAVRAYANRFGALTGKKIALLANNDSALRTIEDLTAAGAETHLIDTRTGSHIVDVKGTNSVRAVVLNSGEKINVDCVAVSGGWNPNVHLTCHKRGRPVWSDELSCFLPNPDDLSADMKVAGAANGRFSTHGALQDGARLAIDAVSALGFDSKKQSLPQAEDSPPNIHAFWFVEGKKRAWVDFQNDVTTKDIKLAHQEGFISVEHLKRYTTLSMATDQGKLSNVVGMAVMADATGKTIAETGTTIFRPPYTPVSIGALAGPHQGKDFKPTRLTPSHQYAAENGATFVETGYWKRAQWIARPGEQGWRDSVDREVLMTRNSVGICDVTTLGKIDVQGTDAGKFLNFVYANTFSTLKVGKCRYGLMLREDGMAMDDGTTARLSENHYVMTTTTANAVSVFRHLEFCRQCLKPDMDVHLISVTEQWAQYAVAGPNARKLLQHIVDPEFDISNSAFPYMACGEITVCKGTRARLFRLSFSGELAYEISVPARYGDSLITALMDAGKKYDVIPYGTEALGVMRIEKGHAAGNELNGQTTAKHLGLGKMISKKKDCIGNVLSERESLNLEDGLELVGFKPVNKSEKLLNGAHFIGIDDDANAETDQGYMSSVCYSPMLKSYIGLGFIKSGSRRKGEIVQAIDLLRGSNVEVEIVSPHFFDPDGGRLRV
ncbi:MAG: sarcosine oxidase subunit alpha family protein [Hyphomonadaceae bacterium]|nr:sarcosine oxidase subunit alpha family protein [Hyphomonadaceae bacterium]